MDTLKMAIASRRRTTAVDTVITVLTVFLAFIFLFPLYWAIIGALKEPRELFLVPPTWFPPNPRWSNFSDVFDMIPFGLFFKNTFILTILSTIGGTISASLVAYGFAFFRFPERNVLFILVLSTMMLPSEVTLVPQYVMFSKINWIDDIKPLFVPLWFGGGAFSIFLFRQFFSSIPQDLSDAAKIDGCSSIRFYLSILLPLSTPAIITLSIIFFQGSWNDLMGPLIYLNTTEKQTISIGLLSLRSVAGGSVQAGQGYPVENILMAASVMAMLPLVVIFFALQRYFIRGVIMTGIKG